jgi:hypothetical protein
MFATMRKEISDSYTEFNKEGMDRKLWVKSEQPGQAVAVVGQTTWTE